MRLEGEDASKEWKRAAGATEGGRKICSFIAKEITRMCVWSGKAFMAPQPGSEGTYVCGGMSKRVRGSLKRGERNARVLVDVETRSWLLTWGVNACTRLWKSVRAPPYREGEDECL